MTEEEKRNHFVSVRFSTDEKEKLKNLAVAHQKTLSEMVRSVTLGTLSLSRAKIIPQVNRKLYFELGKVSEKLEKSEISSEALNELQRLLNEVRRELLGLDS